MRAGKRVHDIQTADLARAMVRHTEENSLIENPEKEELELAAETHWHTKIKSMFSELY